MINYVSANFANKYINYVSANKYMIRSMFPLYLNTFRQRKDGCRKEIFVWKVKVSINMYLCYVQQS